MTILAVHNYYKHRGGEDAVFENESLYLEQQGHKVIRYIKKNTETDKYSFIKKIFFFIRTFHNPDTVKDLKKIVSENNIQIVHIHNVFPIISPSIYRYFHKKKIKIIQTIHNYRFLCPNGLFFINNKICTRCMNGNFLNCIRYRCYKKSLVLSILYASVIFTGQNVFKKFIGRYIALTGFVKKIFTEAGYDQNIIDIKDNGFIDTGIRRENDRGYFLFLGRISFEKGIEFLLDSFGRLSEFKLIVAGESDDLDEFKKKYNNLNIEFTGFISGNKKYDLLSHATALVVPSVWYENYPMSVVEAFCCGIPVIASGIGGLPFIIEDYKNGLIFKTGDFEALKEKCSRIIINKALRDNLGNNARQTYVERMEMSKNIIKLISIYKETFDGKN